MKINNLGDKIEQIFYLIVGIAVWYIVIHFLIKYW